MREFWLEDHIGGFDCNYKNAELDKLGDTPSIVHLSYVVDNNLRAAYPHLILKPRFDGDFELIHHALANYKLPPINKEFKNFVCSFNGTGTLSRQFLTAALYKFNWINSGYFSKNFYCFRDRIDGNISQFFIDEPDQERVYRKFIISDTDQADEFYNSIVSIQYDTLNHAHNIQYLFNGIHNSFLQIVGETEGTTYYPFISEKFTYPIVCKTLWVMYGQPGWYEHINKYYGFKLHTKIFDYSFDRVLNPVVRLIEIMSMVSKFEKLSVHDWHDLYLLEQDTIEYNYDWYRSGNYLKRLTHYG